MDSTRFFVSPQKCSRLSAHPQISPELQPSPSSPVNLAPVTMLVGGRGQGKQLALAPDRHSVPISAAWPCLWHPQRPSGEYFLGPLGPFPQSSSETRGGAGRDTSLPPFPEQPSPLWPQETTPYSHSRPTLTLPVNPKCHPSLGSLPELS